MRIWIDVEDLFHYAAHVSRPSGIQRLAFELQRALAALAPDDVRFVRHDKAGTGLAIVSFAAVGALFADLAEPVSHQASAPAAAPSAPASETGPPALPPAFLPRRLARRVMARLPGRIAEPVRRFRIRQAEALRALLDLLRALLRPPRAATTRAGAYAQQAEPAAADRAFETAVAPGDWLLVLGSPWFAANYGGLVAQLRTRHGLHFALLVYDIIPIRRPEWVDHTLARSFNAWFHSVVPLADRVFAISRTTAEDVEAYARESGLALNGRVHPIPLGTGFGTAPKPVCAPHLPQPGSFALIVSTIEARKNHMLLFRVWRELLATMPAERVPTLVFAGRVGWLVADLMQQLENADWLGGKIRLIAGPSDGELAALYQDCLFTLFPSLYEGWGLPVTESLAHGAPCLAAGRTSLPEAGGTLARYFDPDDLHDAVRAVRAVLDDPAALVSWRAEIRENFRPVPWAESAAAVLDILRPPPRTPAGAVLPDAAISEPAGG
jgi:glycosyltransferase involved in cell wall biosynthesis